MSQAGVLVAVTCFVAAKGCGIDSVPGAGPKFLGLPGPRQGARA